MDSTCIEESLVRYQQLAQLSNDIEQAFQIRDANALTSLCHDMNTLQEETKAGDTVLFDQLRRQPALKESPQMRELIALMQHIQERNKRLTPQIRSVMAVQRDELQKLRQGNRVLQGYRPAPNQTGRRISSAN
jgi:hypothetical protein